MKILKYFIFALFLSILSCKNYDKNKSEKSQYVKLLWENAKFDWVPSSLISNEKQLYFADLNNNFYSINIDDSKVGLNFKTNYNPFFKPLIFEQNIFLTEYGNDLNCFEKNGKLKWKIEGEINLKNDLSGYKHSVYGSVQGNGFSKINTTNGKVIWFLPKDSNITETNKPAFCKETIYLGLSELTVKLFAINNENGKIIWENRYEKYNKIRQYKSEKGLIVLVENDFKNGKILLLSYENGKEIWSSSLNSDMHYEPCIVNNNLILSTNDNKIKSLKIENGIINWTINLNKDQVQSNIIYFNENIYFGTMNRNLYSVNIKKKKINFIQPFNYGIVTPTVQNNKIYFPTGGNEIWVLK